MLASVFLFHNLGFSEFLHGQLLHQVLHTAPVKRLGILCDNKERTLLNYCSIMTRPQTKQLDKVLELKVMKSADQQ